MSQPTQIAAPTTPEEDAAQLAAAIEASKQTALEWDNFAELLGVVGDIEIAENEAEFESAKAESKREYDELELALELSKLDLKDETVQRPAPPRRNRLAMKIAEEEAETAHAPKPISKEAVELARLLSILSDECPDDAEAMDLIAQADSRMLAGDDPAKIIDELRLRRFIDSARADRAVRMVTEGLIAGGDVVSVLLGIEAAAPVW